MQYEPDGVPSESGAPSSPGARLRQARERRGDSIGEVAQALKLAPRQIEALERGDHQALPGPAFVRGFMRNYARYLGLDPEPLLAETKASLERMRVDLSPVQNAEGDLPSRGGNRRPAKGTGPAAMLVGLLLVVIVVGWYFDWFEPTSTLPVAVEPQPQQIQPQVIDSAPAPFSPPTTADTGVPPPAPAVPAVEAPPAAAPPAEAGGPPPVVSETPAAGAAGTLVFRFDTQSWIEVRDASGRVIYSGTNNAGSTRTVQGQAPFRLVVGNARAVQLEHGGQKVDLVSHIRGTVARLTVN